MWYCPLIFFCLVISAVYMVVYMLRPMFIVKNLTDFRKTVETGVDPRLRPILTKKTNALPKRGSH